MSLVATSFSTPGSLRQEVVVDGRFRLATDEPVRLGGTDSAPSPHELLPAAIAACVSTNILMYAQTKGWELGAVDDDLLPQRAGRRERRCTEAHGSIEPGPREGCLRRFRDLRSAFYRSYAAAARRERAIRSRYQWKLDFGILASVG